MTQTSKTLKQMEMFDMITKVHLTPDQYYFLCCMREGVSPLRINSRLQMRLCQQNGWLDAQNKLTGEAIQLLLKIEKFFATQKKKTSTDLMGSEFKMNMTLYIDMFPNIKLPSGKAARSAMGNLEKNFRWFFENHKYTWAEVLQATAKYANDQQKNNFKFMRTSQYFIKKNQLSDLADCCEMLRSGGNEEPKPAHSINVV